MEIVVASQNSAKVSELRQLLSHLPVKVLSLDDVPAVPEVIEDGATYEENAAKKARAVFEATGKMALADDSGLEVDALQGQPGIKSARFGGEGLSDHERNVKLLKMMENVPDDERGATFHCTVVIAGPKKMLKAVEGTCRGSILREPRGGGGFGYDPVFMPGEYNQTFAELLPDVKNKISHRGRALEKAALFLEGYTYSQREE
jgi:XTP/dITP diphosphohydrolase